MSKRRYEKITNEQRKNLIEMVEQQGHKIKKAAAELDIPYENAKAIFRVYRKDSR
jgi:transposase-like protein